MEVADFLDRLRTLELIMPGPVREEKKGLLLVHRDAERTMKMEKSTHRRLMEAELLPL